MYVKGPAIRLAAGTAKPLLWPKLIGGGCNPPPLWTKLAQQHDGKDRWYLEALGIALDKQQDKFFSAWLETVGSDWDTPTGRDIVWRSRSKKTSELLVKILLNEKTKEEEKPRYIRALDFQSGPEKDAALIKLIGAGS